MHVFTLLELTDVHAQLIGPNTVNQAHDFDLVSLLTSVPFFCTKVHPHAQESPVVSLPAARM